MAIGKWQSPETWNFSTMTNSILIPTDFSEACDNAVTHGAEIARYLNSKLYLLHVVNRDTKHYLRKHDLPLEYIDEKLDTLAQDIASNYNVITA